MGPRVRRRVVVTAVAALLVAAAIVGIVLATSGSSGASPRHTQTSKKIYGVFGAFGIVDGMHPSEVRARLGAPDQKRNGCWIYHIHGPTFHGYTLAPQLTDVDAVRYCMYVGVVSVIEDHWRPINGVAPWGHPWAPPVSYGCGGKPCHPVSP